MSIVNSSSPIIASTPENGQLRDGDKSARDSAAKEARAQTMTDIVSVNSQAANFASALETIHAKETAPAARIVKPSSPPIWDRMEDIPFWKGNRIHTSKILKIRYRSIAAITIGEIRVPFYISSGHAPKEGVTPGKWYPFFGVADHWLVKESGIRNYYGSEKLRQVAAQLDEEVGDRRDDPETPYLEDYPNATLMFLNDGMSSIVDEVLEVGRRGAGPGIRAMVERIEAIGEANHDASENCQIL